MIFSEHARVNRRDFVMGASATALLSATHAGASSAERTSLPEGAWQRLTTESFPGKQDDIFFVDRLNGWYGNGAGKLYRTVDGGDTWQMIWERPGTHIRALGFVDQRVGFLGNIGANLFPNASDTNPLYRTHDGGISWQPIVVPDGARVAGICAIHILPTRRGRGGRIIHAAGRVGGPAMVMRSEDGGETWQIIDLSAHAAMIQDIYFHNADIGFIAASAPAQNRDGDAVILMTRDGGRHWSSVYRSGRALENIWKMSWPSRAIGYATIQNNAGDPARSVQRIVKTIDGGRHWYEITLVDDGAATELGIGFLDANRGWVGTRTSAFETRDGGAHWSPIDLGRAVNKFRFIRDAHGSRVFAIGNQIHRLDIGA